MTSILTLTTTSLVPTYWWPPSPPMTPQPTSPSLWAAAGYTGGTTPKCTRVAPPSNLQQCPWKSSPSFSRTVLHILFSDVVTLYNILFSPNPPSSPPHFLSLYTLNSLCPLPPILSLPFQRYIPSPSSDPRDATVGRGRLCWAPMLAAALSIHDQSPCLSQLSHQATPRPWHNGHILVCPMPPSLALVRDVTHFLCFLAQVVGPRLHCHRDLSPPVGQFYRASHRIGVTCCPCAHPDC